MEWRRVVLAGKCSHKGHMDMYFIYGRTKAETLRLAGHSLRPGSTWNGYGRTLLGSYSGTWSDKKSWPRKKGNGGKDDDDGGTGWWKSFMGPRLGAFPWDYPSWSKLMAIRRVCGTWVIGFVSANIGSVSSILRASHCLTGRAYHVTLLDSSS